MCLGVGIGLDQPTVRGTANQITRVHGQGASLRRCRCNLRALFALFAVPFPCFDAIPHAP